MNAVMCQRYKASYQEVYPENAIPGEILSFAHLEKGKCFDFLVLDHINGDVFAYAVDPNHPKDEAVKLILDEVGWHRHAMWEFVPRMFSDDE
jgi:hypothetical protein